MGIFGGENKIRILRFFKEKKNFEREYVHTNLDQICQMVSNSLGRENFAPKGVDLWALTTHVQTVQIRSYSQSAIFDNICIHKAYKNSHNLKV